MAEKTMTNFYETLFIVDLSNGEDAVKATENKFTSLISENGEIIEVKDKEPHWGKRRLAYEINDKSEGFYVVVTFKANTDFPNELYRLLNIDENVLRSIVVKLDYVPTVTVEEISEETVVTSEEPVAEEAAPAEEVAEVTAPAEETPVVEENKTEE